MCEHKITFRKYYFGKRLRGLLFFFLCLTFFSVKFSFAQHHSSTSHYDSVGKINFRTSCSPEVKDQFNHALAMLHHMMYDHAEIEFEKVLKSDPNCAMAYWGLAMSYFHPLWYQPTEEDMKKGREAILKASELNPPTEREKKYISALTEFFQDTAKIIYADRLAKWETAQQKLFEEYPDDIDAGAFYALSLLASAPKSDKNFTNQKKAGAILEGLHKKAPEHPGLFHYIIHAYDNPVLASRALDVARDYDKLAPDVPHALHMPSHIFVRLGLWSEVINWNIRSAKSALKHSIGSATSNHYFHALDYLMYAYLQQVKDKKAKDVLDKINKKENREDILQSAYGTCAAQARFVLERKQWKEAAVLPARNPQAFPWDKYPYSESIIYFARGIGAARIGNVNSAKNALEKLDELYNKTVDLKQNYWGILVDVQRITVSAWIAFAEGKKDEALDLMKKAADLEDSVDKHPVTPGAILPARELLGDMLLLLKKPEDALFAYETTLRISPNRFNSLFGAAYSSELMENKDKAKFYYLSLKKLSSNADSQRPELEQMKTFLRKNLSLNEL